MFDKFSMSNFEKDFAKAKSANSTAGGACVFVGWLTPFIALFFAAYAFGQGEVSLFGISIGAAILSFFTSAPLIAFGNMANDQRRQTALLALQTWQQQKNINPELGDFKMPNML